MVVTVFWRADSLALNSLFSSVSMAWSNNVAAGVGVGTLLVCTGLASVVVVEGTDSPKRIAPGGVAGAACGTGSEVISCAGDSVGGGLRGSFEQCVWV